MLTLDNTSEAIKRAQTYLDHDIYNKRRHDGVPNNAAVTCQKYGGNHSGACWLEGEQKREEGLALLKEADIILASKKNNKPSSSEIKALKVVFIANNERY